MKAPFWTIRAAKNEPKVGELLLYGEISSVSWWGDEVTPQQFKKDLDALGDITELRVFINSPGGDVFAGQAIYSMIRRHSATKIAYIDGLAASMASVIPQACDKIIMPRNSMMMVHNPWTIAAGNAGDFRRMADDLDKIRESLIAAYQDKSGMDREELIGLLDAETWMTAEEAVEKGFADEIEDSRAVAASVDAGRLVVNGQRFDLSRFRHPPKLAFLPTQQAPQAAESFSESARRRLEIEKYRV